MAVSAISGADDSAVTVGPRPATEAALRGALQHSRRVKLYLADGSVVAGDVHSVTHRSAWIDGPDGAVTVVSHTDVRLVQIGTEDVPL